MELKCINPESLVDLSQCKLNTNSSGVKSIAESELAYWTESELKFELEYSIESWFKY
jgi:hypothetical protein